MKIRNFSIYSIKNEMLLVQVTQEF